MIYESFEEIPFNNNAPQRLKQTYAVLYYLCNGNTPKSSILKASDAFPQIQDRYQTIESKISTQINASLNDFFQWFEDNTILNELVARNRLDEHDRDIFGELLNYEGFDTSHIPEELHEPIDTLKEGAIKNIAINAYERSAKARKLCIEEYGYICSVCECKLKDKYGDIGENYIHVHHIVPLAEINAEYEVDPIRDLRPICPNCHAMIHTNKIPYTIDELKVIMQNATQHLH